MSKQIPGYLGAWTLWDSPDPRINFANYYSENGNINWYGYSDPEMEQLVNRSFLEFDQEAAAEILLDAQKLALEDGGASHFTIVGSISLYLKWPYLHRVGPSLVSYDIKELPKAWIDQSDPTFAGKTQI